MVRISDCQGKGPSYGTCVLHVAPESSIGGPLALVRTGDMIELDVGRHSLNVGLSADEMKRRRESWKLRESPYERGYLSLFLKHVIQANEGCDFDFLRGRGGVSEPDIF